MPEHLRFHVLPAFAALLFAAAPVHAEMGAIRDNGAFFSAQAKTEALRNIGEIGRRFKKELVFETFGAIPEDLKPGVDLTNKTAMGRFYEEWAAKQAKQQRVNGIYVLLVKEPAHLQVLVGNETQRNAFTLRDRDALVSLMLAKLHKKQNDDALLESVNFVSTTMQARLPSHSRGPMESRRVESPSSSGWILKALVIGLVVLVVLRIVRGIFAGVGGVAGGGGGYGGGYGGGSMVPGSGGGFMGNMLGGMFGAAAGMWIYDQFSGRSSGSSSWGGGDLENRGDSGFSGQDTDYSGSGGDFGGGDSGGGDSGGGGFGGSDSGGSDFGGGGGGDF